MSSAPRSMAGGYSGPPPMRAKEEKAKKSARREEPMLERERDVAAPIDAAYLVSLATLARELDAHGRGRADAAAIRGLRQRLTEWVEDVRSVGTSDELATIVERLVQRLSAALTVGTAVAAETIAIAAELATLAAGGSPTPTKGSRVAFWK